MPTPAEVEYFESLDVRVERATELEALYRARGFPAAQFPRVKSGHYPTDAGNCLRKRVLDFMGMPASDGNTFEGETIFAMGNALGDIQAMMAMRAGIYLGDESSFVIREPGLTYPFSGRIDVVIEDAGYDSVTRIVEHNGMITAVENKTIKSNGYYTRKYPSGFTLIGASEYPKPDNVKQLTHYLHYLNLLADEDGFVHFNDQYEPLRAPTHGYLCYLCKDDQRMTMWKVNYAPKLWASIVEEAAVVEDYVARDVLPPRHPRGKIGFAHTDDPDTGLKKGAVDYAKGKFPCSWDGGACKFLRLCHAPTIETKGNDEERERLTRLPVGVLNKEEEYE